MGGKKHKNVEAQMPEMSVQGILNMLETEIRKGNEENAANLLYISKQITDTYGGTEQRLDQKMKAVAQEIRFSYKQNQTIYDSLSKSISSDLFEQLKAVEARLAALEQLQTILKATETLKDNDLGLQASCDAIGTILSDDLKPQLKAVAEKQAKLEEIETALAEIQAKLTGFLPTEDDYAKLTETINEKTQESVSESNRQVLEAIAGIPVAENVDYNRIVEEVGDKLLELLNEIKGTEEKELPAEPVEAKIDYDRIIYGAAEKVIESLPAPAKIDYARIEACAAAQPAPEIDYERLAELVATKIAVPAAPEIDYDRLAELVAEKIAVPAAPEVNCDCIAECVVEKMTANAEQTCDVVLDEEGIEGIASKVADKLSECVEAIDYDKVCQAAQAAQILPDPVDYDRIAEIVEDKVGTDEAEYDLVIDAEGIDAIAKGVAEQLCVTCVPVEEAEVVATEEEPVAEEAAPVEEAVEEVVEEVVEEAPVAEEEITEEIAEEVAVEEVVSDPIDQAPVEDAVPVEAEVAPVEEELAVAATPAYEEIDDQLVDAETGLVVRLKKSFTAKMKQSDERIKEYYSDIKNELIAYKRLNSNVSWHGDRFNYGRDTIAKINISGKTLCFYLALDPNDPEFKQTVYHQKDVSAQKAYESTPFMVKIKSDAAAKKALRLVGCLAQKLGAERDFEYQKVDYTKEFGYESTKQLFDEGFIKATKEKKVDFDF